MLKVALRGLLARRVRLLLTLASIVAGVMLVSGTFVFTDTINRSFDRIFSATYAGIDVAITRPDRPDSDFTDSPPLPAALVDRVRGVDGVDAVEGAVFDEATVLGKDGERIGAGGAPNFIASKSSVEEFNSFEVPDGRLPEGPREAAIDKATADREGFAVGDALDVQGAGEREQLRIVGTTRVAGVDSFGGATIVVTTLPEAQRILGNPGYDEIDVAAADGVTPQQLADRLEPVIGADGTVRTGEQEADEQTAQIKEDLGFLQHRAAGVRRHRAVRGRLLDLQHLLDHRRPAHPGVRAAADDGRLARAGPAVRARGGRAAGARRRRDRRRGGDPGGLGAAGDDEARRIHRARPGHGGGAPDDHRRGRSSDCSSPSSRRWRRRCAPPACRRWPRCARGPSSSSAGRASRPPWAACSRRSGSP